MPFPTYAVSTDFPQGDVDLRRLYDEILAAGPYEVSPGVVSTPGGASQDDDGILTVEFDVAPSAAGQTIVDGLVAAHTMPTAIDKARTKRSLEIDVRTQQLIKAGFVFPPGSGVRFSLSANSQRSLLAADSARADPAFTYPVSWNSIDDLVVQTLATATDVHNFFLTAIGTVRAVLDSGTALKDSVRAALTVNAVEAITDLR